MRTTVTRTALAVALAVGTAVTAAPSASAMTCPLPRFGPGPSYAPHATGLRPEVTNPWFPLRPGTTLVYRGVKDGEPARDVTTVTDRTRRVGGVRARVVEDRLYLSGRLRERTSDYYAQDACGNVWYLGEDTAELDARGRVTSTEGTWHSGVDHAKLGVVMQAHPEVGRRFRQEWLAGQAEDVFWVARRSTRIGTPYAQFRHALSTRERTDLEPGVLDAKWYVRGIGEVAEIALRGPQEHLRLVDVRR